MTCRGFQYEIGKTYREDSIQICKKGFHFCKNLIDVFNYYNKSKSRFFEIEASGDIVTEQDKSVASEITILKEVNRIDVNRALYGNGYGDGDGYGYGNGNGYGYGDGNGNGYGDGYGDGNGNGYGYGDGNGNGDGNIQKILNFN